MEERIEFIKNLNTDLMQGYNTIKKHSILPDIKNKVEPTKLNYIPSSRFEGFISPPITHKWEVLRVNKNIEEMGVLNELKNKTIEKTRKILTPDRRKSIRISSSTLALEKLMSPLSKRDIFVGEHKKVYDELMKGNPYQWIILCLGTPNEDKTK